MLRYIVKLLLDKCKSSNINFNTFTSNTKLSLLSVAASAQHQNMIDLLLEYGALVCMDEGNKTSALHEASQKANINICRQLIYKNGVYLIHTQNSQGLTPINYLINRQQENYVLELLASCPVNIKARPVNIDGNDYLLCS